MSTLNIHGRLIMVAMPDEDLPSLMSSGKLHNLADVRFVFCSLFIPFTVDLSKNGALLGGSKMYVVPYPITLLKLTIVSRY
jgi:hypothetical protein